jgi:hypothetical protein
MGKCRRLSQRQSAEKLTKAHIIFLEGEIDAATGCDRGIKRLVTRAFLRYCRVQSAKILTARPVAQLKHATVLQIQAAEKASRTFVRRAKPKRTKIAAGNPNRSMAEVAVTLLSKTCPKRGKTTLIVRLQKTLKKERDSEKNKILSSTYNR